MFFRPKKKTGTIPLFRDAIDVKVIIMIGVDEVGSDADDEALRAEVIHIIHGCVKAKPYRRDIAKTTDLIIAIIEREVDAMYEEMMRLINA